MDHLFTASTAPEYSEKELRQIEDFQSFFDNWDDDYYTEQGTFRISEIFLQKLLFLILEKYPVIYDLITIQISDCLDLMQQAVNGRIEVYQEVRKTILIET